MTRTRAKYALTGIARCGTCDAAIGCASTPVNGVFVKQYACTRHHHRGPRACGVTVRQPMPEIEAALLEYLERHVFTTEKIDAYAHEIRASLEAQIPKRETDVAELETELRAVKAEQKKLTKAVAIADDVPDLVTELRQRATRARSLEMRIAAVRRAPEETRGKIENAEALVRERLGDVRTALRDRGDLRRVSSGCSRRASGSTQPASATTRSGKSPAKRTTGSSSRATGCPFSL
jgi:hypothetical protein